MCVFICMYTSFACETRPKPPHSMHHSSNKHIHMMRIHTHTHRYALARAQIHTHIIIHRVGGFQSSRGLYFSVSASLFIGKGLCCLLKGPNGTNSERTLFYIIVSPLSYISLLPHCAACLLKITDFVPSPLSLFYSYIYRYIYHALPLSFHRPVCFSSMNDRWYIYICEYIHTYIRGLYIQVWGKDEFVRGERRELGLSTNHYIVRCCLSQQILGYHALICFRCWPENGFKNIHNDLEFYNSLLIIVYIIKSIYFITTCYIDTHLVLAFKNLNFTRAFQFFIKK